MEVDERKGISCFLHKDRHAARGDAVEKGPEQPPETFATGAVKLVIGGSFSH